MISIDPSSQSVPEIQRLLQGGIAPRPIALVSTTGKNGDNLSPFSFYNIFSSNPPVLIFSPALRGKDGTSKDTLNNVQETGECVVSTVTYDMVQQVSLASTEYATGVDEFVKSGLTKLPSQKVAPPRVAESPFQMECKVNQIQSLGNGPGAGNLVICEIVLIHVHEKVFSGASIDPAKMQQVARMGGDYYCVANEHSVFTVEKPLLKKGIGVDMLPDFLRLSKRLTGNDLGKLGNVERFPAESEIEQYRLFIQGIQTDEIIPNQDLFLLYLQKNAFSQALQLLLNNKDSLCTTENVMNLFTQGVSTESPFTMLIAAQLLREYMQ